MDENTAFQQLKKLIAQNKTQAVIDQLVADAPGFHSLEHQKILLLLSARWKELLARLARGTISPADAQVENSQINENLLDLLDALAAPQNTVVPPTLANSTIPDHATPAPGINWKKILTTIGAVIAVLAGLAELTGYSIRDWWEQPQTTSEQIAGNTIDSSSTTTKSIDTLPQELPPPTSKQPTSTAATTIIQDAKPASPPDQLPPPKASLSLDVKTNKGTEDLLFYENEEVRLYFQVNRPCNLRCIYQLADGSLILLDDDRQVNTPETKQWVELADGFEVAPPFGTEKLYVFAQEAPFPKLTVEEIAGYTYIIEGLPSALRKTRGLKKKAVFAEKILTINTKQRSNN